MGDSKYGRLFTEADAFQLVWEALGGSMGGVESEEARAAFSRALRELDAVGRDPEYGLTFPADEPLFLLRGQDEMAHHGTDEYGLACYRDPRVGEDHARAVATASRKLVEWQRANPDRVKVPD